MTQLNWGRQLALAIALVLLGGSLYWYEAKYQPSQEKKKVSNLKVFQIGNDQIKKLTLNTPQEDETLQEVSFSCLDLGEGLCKPGSNSSWKMESPIQVKADRANVNSLISAVNHLNALEVISLLEESEENIQRLLTDYELHENQRSDARRIEIQTFEGKTYTAYIGATHPIGGKIFAGFAENGEFDNTRVFLLSPTFIPNFRRGISYWRDKNLFDFTSHEVTGFQLKGSHESLLAEKQDGLWILKEENKGGEPEEELRGDVENIDNLLTSVAYLRATAFASEDKNSPDAQAILKGLRPILSLRFKRGIFSTADGETTEESSLELFQEVHSGKDDSRDKDGARRVFAKTSELDPLFEVSSDSLRRLDKSLGELRLARLITSMERFTVNQLHFNGVLGVDGQTVTLVSQDAQWRAHSPQGLEINEDQIENFLDQLSATRIQEFLGQNRIPSGAERGVRVGLGTEENSEQRQFLFWKDEKDVYVRDLQRKRNEVFRLDSRLTVNFPWSVDYFSSMEAEENFTENEHISEGDDDDFLHDHGHDPHHDHHHE
jgi:hypothetical protein